MLRGYRLTAVVLLGVLIPQFAVTQVGAPRVNVRPLADSVNGAAKRILAYQKPYRDLVSVRSQYLPGWVKKAPASYANENDSILSNTQVNSSTWALLNRGDIMTGQQELELQQRFGDMNRDFDQRSIYGLTDPDTMRVQYDRLKDFSREVFRQVSRHQGRIYRSKFDLAAKRDKNLTSTPVKLAGSISAIYFDSPVMVALSEETRISAHTSVADQTGGVSLVSPVVNGTLELDARAEDALLPGTVPIDPTWRREKYRVSFSRPVGILDMTTGFSYGSTTTQMSASIVKPISNQVTCVVDSVRPLNASGATSEERVKVLYGINF